MYYYVVSTYDDQLFYLLYYCRTTELGSFVPFVCLLYIIIRCIDHGTHTGHAQWCTGTSSSVVFFLGR